MYIRSLLESYKKLRVTHFNILKVMEKALNRFYFVPIQYIARKTRIKKNKLSKIMSFMEKEKIVKRSEGGYEGYALTYKALDILALNDFTDVGMLTDFGGKIGVGKEGEIWVAYFGSVPRILKFYRLGRESFKKVRVRRSYYIDRSIKNWFQASIRSAKREYSALKVLYDHNVRVPEPLKVNRHAILMDYIDGKELVKTILEEPIIVFENIILEVFKGWKIGYVHADLSEFNVMVTKEGQIYLIDWPQYVVSTHPLAEVYLKRDIENIVKYFIRKYRISRKKLNEIIKTCAKTLNLDYSY